MRAHGLGAVHLYSIPILIFLMELKQTISSPTAPSCITHSYTTSGKCCHRCPPGEGEVVACGQNNTRCEPCRINHTFSLNWSFEKCRMCRQCGPDAIVVKLCNLTHDTTCRCEDGYFLKENGWQCSQCGVCPPGYGTVVPCSPDADIVCTPCIPGRTFSNTVTKATTCKPCTRCAKGVSVLANCTHAKDTVCADQKDQTIDSVMTSPPHAYSDGPQKKNTSVSVVPIYCILLSALVVGLLMYVLFKRWSFQKVKLRQTHKMIRSNTSTTDIEKGCSPTSNGNPSNPVDTHLLNGHVSTVPLMAVPAATPYTELHSDRKLQLEEDLMKQRSDKNDWRGLAKQLHFNDTDRKKFSNHIDVHSNSANKMLNSWISRDGEKATTLVLVQALKKIGREDLAKSIPIQTDAI